MHTGWNFFLNTVVDSIQYRYIRFRHNTTSNCQIAELQFIGKLYSTYTVDPNASYSCPITVLLPSGSINIPTASVNYKASSTSTVNAVVPVFGPSTGGTVIEVRGINFGSSLTVAIDGINCPIINQTATNLFCTTGIRDKPPTSGNSFVLTSQGNAAILTTEPFIYIDRWSSQDTWGGEALPREGDSVYVPPGMTLLVDVPSTPVLYSIIVEGGRIIFSDEMDMTLDSHYFVIIGG